MKLMLLLALISSNLAFAANSTIVQLHESGEYSDNSVSLFLSSGEIVHIPVTSAQLIKKARVAFKNQRLITLKTLANNSDEAQVVISLKLVKTQISEPETFNKNMYSWAGQEGMNFQTRDALEKSNITMLSNYDTAQNIMETFNGETREKSQCYNRAHVWSYEALINHGTNLGKVWIFFTRKYIREFKHKWWFHIAPYTHVNDSNKIYVLDRGFTMIPYNLDNWKNLFIKNKAKCPVITDYNDYANHQRSEYCYLILSSQYYWQPWQIQSLTNKQNYTYGYKQNELRIAYRDALISWDHIVPEFVNKLPSVAVEEVESEFEILEQPRVSTPDATGNSRLSFGRFKVGDRVMDADSDVGTILEINNNGRFLIDFDRYNSHFERLPNYLGKEISCFMSFCQNERVIDRGSDIGVIKSIFDNGNALVNYERFSNSLPITLKELSARTECHTSICVGNLVGTYGSYNAGVVLDVFTNGRARVKYERGETEITRTNLLVKR